MNYSENIPQRYLHTVLERLGTAVNNFRNVINISILTTTNTSNLFKY